MARRELLAFSALGAASLAAPAANAVSGPRVDAAGRDLEQSKAEIAQLREELGMVEGQKIGKKKPAAEPTKQAKGMNKDVSQK